MRSHCYPSCGPSNSNDWTAQDLSLWLKAEAKSNETNKNQKPLNASAFSSSLPLSKNMGKFMISITFLIFLKNLFDIQVNFTENEVSRK